jgi:hypothetical protein
MANMIPGIINRMNPPVTKSTVIIISRSKEGKADRALRAMSLVLSGSPEVLLAKDIIRAAVITKEISEETRDAISIPVLPEIIVAAKAMAT